MVTNGKQYAVVFERRDRVSTVGSAASGGECEWEETLSLECTMYRDEKDLFEEKMAKLSVVEVSNGEQPDKTVGAISFDLKDYCDESEEGLTNTVALSLSVGGVKKQGAGTLYVTISTHQVEEQPAAAESRDRSSTKERSSQFEVMGLKSELERERAAKKSLMDDQNRLLKVVRTMERKEGGDTEAAIAEERKRQP